MIVGGLLVLLLILLIVVMLTIPSGENASSQGEPSTGESSSSSSAQTDDRSSADDNPTHKGEAVRTPWEGAQLATITTNRGDMTFLLFSEEAPRSVENFVNLANAGLYDGVSFGRPIRDAYITVTKPKNATISSLPLETDPTSVWHYYGALGYSGDDAAQFRIITQNSVDAETLQTMRDSGMWPEEVIDRYATIGGIPGFDDRYTVFGQLIEGEDVLTQIVEGGPVESSESSDDSPMSETQTIIESISISTYHE